MTGIQVVAAAGLARQGRILRFAGGLEVAGAELVVYYLSFTNLKMDQKGREGEEGRVGLELASELDSCPMELMAVSLPL
ncbi:hypothetical protein BH11PLA1_BH11PLA1_22220 [soil metagenome]